MSNRQTNVRRVLFVTTDFSLGNVSNGPGVYCHNLWRFFSEDPEIEFHVVCSQSDTQHPRIHTLPSVPGGFGNAVYKAVETLTQEVVAQLGSQTIVHVNSAHILSPAFVKSCLSIVQVNDTEVCQWRPSIASLKRHGARRNLALAWRRRREKSVVKSAAKTVCNSRHTETAVRQEYGITDQRVTTIYKAIDLTPFHRASLEHTPDAEMPTLVFIGSNWALKGIDTVCHAIATLKKSQCDVRVMVFGRPNKAMQEDAESLVQSLNIGDRIIFRGQVTREDLPGELAKAKALVMPSRSEALGLAAIESLATGTPVVASNVGGLPEVVSDDACGRLVPPDSPQELAAAIETVLGFADDAQARQIRQSFVKKFDAAQLETELRKLYSQTGEG